jgi:nuclear control of ATPase protein 2
MLSFVGLTPGILVSVALFRYLGGVFGNRKGLRRHKRQGEIVRTLRNIDRILTNSVPSPSSNGMLSYKEHGLLVCEVHVLRQKALSVLPGEVRREFLEEVRDLVDIRTGVVRQQKVVERIRWAYKKWMY